MALFGAVLCLGLYKFGYARFVPGLGAGILAGMLNCLLLSYQLKKCTRLPMQKAVSYIQAGWLVRLSLVTVLLLMSVLIAEINFLAALAGFFLFQAIVIVRAVIAYAGESITRKKREERSE